MFVTLEPLEDQELRRLGLDYRAYIENMDEKDVVLIDPPWSYDDKKLVQTQLNYKLWNNDVSFLFENIKSKIIFLWVTNSFLDRTFLDYFKSSHNYVYKTIITWRKLTKTGKEFYGLGNWFRNSTEQLLLFVDKNEKPFRLSDRNIISYPASMRTEKPKQFEYHIFTKLHQKGYHRFAYIFSGPNVEIFHEFDIDVVDIVFSE